MKSITTHHTKKLFLIICILGFFLLIFIFFIYFNKVSALSENSKISNFSPIETVNALLYKTDKEKILAKTFIIYDINNNKLIMGENEEEMLPIASLTKVLTVGTFLETAKKQNIPIREETKTKIQKALIQSSNNDATTLGDIYKYSFDRDLLADSNSLVKEIGAENILLTNLTGLDNTNGTASNMGTSLAMAKIFAYIYQNHRSVFEYTKFEEFQTMDGFISNTNHESNNTFGILASKTGFTYEAGGNLGVIVSPEPGSTYVVLVMNSTKEGRFTDINKIVRLLPIILKKE